ncbi:MAG TPA: phosphopantetheine-binding protein [Mycobacteriales bacterium]|nr:phosphopantetheine-binding protein [Mycobacteriales bacterium]
MPESGAPRFDDDDLRRTVAGVLDVDPAELTDDARFVEDLGGNSLLAFEVLVVLEEKYGVRFSRDEVESLTSLPRTRELLAAKLGVG